MERDRFLIEMSCMCEHDILSFSRSLIATPPPVGGGVSLEQAAFCSIYTSPATEIVELSIEDVRTRAFAGTFAWSKTGDALSAYGIYHVVNAKLEIVSIKRGDDCNYIVYRDAKQIGGIDCLQINSGCIIKVMDACGGVIALTKINHPHNGLLLKVDIRGASYQFIVASRSSFLDFLWCLSNLFLFWCERWRRLRPTKDMVLPSSVCKCSLRDDDIWVMFAFSLLIRSDWLRYKSDIDIGE